MSVTLPVQLLHPWAKAPAYATSGAAALDVFMPRAGRLPPGHPTMLSLGFAAAVPAGFCALLLPRSGLGARYGLHLTNTIGLIDADYRGEWKASLAVTGSEDLVYNRGDRLIQALLVPVGHARVEVLAEGAELPATDRGSAGFGTTGA